MPSYGINFRATSANIADGANQTYSLGEVYPTTRGGVTFGFATDATANTRNRFSTGEPRLAGVAFKGNTGTKLDFRIDLPGGAATYDIRLAMGDRASDQFSKIELFDGTTSFAVIDGNTSVENFRDATGVSRTTAAWPADNVALSRVFTSTYMIVRLGKDTETLNGGQPTSSVIAHLFVDQTSGDDPPTLTGSITPGTITDTSIQFTHPAGADDNAVTSYEYSKDAGSTWTDSGVTTTSYTFTSLTASTSYPIRVRAKDISGNVSTPALSASISTIAPADGTLPVLTGSITVTSLTTTSYTLSWPTGTDNVAVTRYDYSLDGAATWISNSTATTVNIIDRTPGATDQVRVRAADAAGNLSSPVLSTSVTLNNTSITLGPFASNGTVWPSGTSIHVTWLPLGRIGSLAAITPVDRTATLGSGGTVAVTGLAAGAGIALVAKRVTNATDDEVCYQPGTVA